MKKIFLIISIIISILQNSNAFTENQVKIENETLVANKLDNVKSNVELYKYIRILNHHSKASSDNVNFDNILTNIIGKKFEDINLKQCVDDLDNLFTGIIKNPTGFYRTMYNYAKTLDLNLGDGWTKCEVFSENYKNIRETLKKIFTKLHGYNSKIQSRVFSKNSVCADEFSLDSKIYSNFYNLIKKENVIEAFKTCGKYTKEFANEWSNEVKKLVLFMVIATRACEYDFHKTNLNHEELLGEIEDTLNYFTNVVLLKEFKNDQTKYGLIKSLDSILLEFIDFESSKECKDHLDTIYGFFEWKVQYPLPDDSEVMISESDDLCGSYYYKGSKNALVSWCVPSVPNQNLDEESYQREQKELNNMLITRASSKCPDGALKLLSIRTGSDTQLQQKYLNYCVDITEKFKFNDFIIVPEMSKTVISFDNFKTTNKDTPMSVYIGCFIDEQQHDLNQSQYTHSLMTIDSCSKYCFNKGYSYFGVQNSYECFCGNDFGKYGESESINECNAKCGGDSNTYCGGFLRNSIYQSIIEENKTKIDESKMKYLGCSDSVTHFKFFESSNSMNLEKCYETCLQNDYNIFAFQDGSDCYCSNQYEKKGLLNSDKCDYPCTGDYKSMCGGQLTKSIYENLKVYKHGYSKHSGCFSNKPLKNETYTSSNMSIYKCGLYCIKKHYKYFGLLNGNECSCGDNYDKDNEIELTNCVVPCKDKTDELAMCGGKIAQQIYELKNEPFNSKSTLNTNEIIFSRNKKNLVYLQSNGLLKGFDDEFNFVSVNGIILESFELKINNNSLTMNRKNGSVAWTYKFFYDTSSPNLILDEEAKLTIQDKDGGKAWYQSSCGCPCQWAEAHGLHITKSYKKQCFTEDTNTFLPKNAYSCIRNKC